MNTLQFIGSISSQRRGGGTNPQYGTLNGPNLSEAVIDNYITISTSAAQFADYAGNNYRVTDLASPVYQSVNESFIADHPLASEDIDGYRFEIPVNHCYSGVNLMT